MENVKQIVVTNIKWDAPKSANLPKMVVIDINEDNEYLLDGIEEYAEELSDYLSDVYEYCHEGFCVQIKDGVLMNAYQKRKASAREAAIEWQHEFGGKVMSWSEIAYWNHYFTKQAKRYGLTREFRENGII